MAWLLSLLIVLANTPREMPAFADYAVPAETVEAPVVDFNSHPIGPKFRTHIGYTVNKEGANFAGHFTVVVWGCGSPCQQFAIVNLKTGQITHNPTRILSRGVEHRKDSRLLVLNPFTPGENDFIRGLETRYYEWDGERITLLAIESHEP